MRSPYAICLTEDLIWQPPRSSQRSPSSRFRSPMGTRRDHTVIAALWAAVLVSAWGVLCSCRVFWSFGRRRKRSAASPANREPERFRCSRSNLPLPRAEACPRRVSTKSNCQAANTCGCLAGSMLKRCAACWPFLVSLPDLWRVFFVGKKRGFGAHKLARLIYRMLKTGQEYQRARCRTLRQAIP